MACLSVFTISYLRSLELDQGCRLASGVSEDREELFAAAQHVPFNSQEPARRDLLLDHRAFVYQSISNVL